MTCRVHFRHVVPEEWIEPGRECLKRHLTIQKEVKTSMPGTELKHPFN
jgi:hypothetical protein